MTGPKKDDWLVKTMGGMLAVVGASLLLGASEDEPSHAEAALGVGSALALGGADMVYVSRGRISRVYLADALVQALILGGWLIETRRRSPARA